MVGGGLRFCCCRFECCVWWLELCCWWFRVLLPGDPRLCCSVRVRGRTSLRTSTAAREGARRVCTRGWEVKKFGVWGLGFGVWGCGRSCTLRASKESRPRMMQALQSSMKPLKNDASCLSLSCTLMQCATTRAEGQRLLTKAAATSALNLPTSGARNRNCLFKFASVGACHAKP